ncbi:MAG TPA: hypothetical protein VMH77_06555 [Steroidobacteraceae bacterium]|nr:hypothetical protein [Steroidobacteraceae bacterium]
MSARLLPGAAATIEDFPVALAWSPDGTTLAIGGGEGGLYLLSPEGTVRSLGRHAPGVLQLAWQPRGTSLASSGQDGAVLLWQAADPQQAPHVLARATRWPAGLTWRADGQYLAFAQGRDVLLFDAAGQPAGQLGGHGVALSHLLWRGRDELLGAGNGALFVDRVGGAIEQFTLEGTPVTLALSPDLKVVASGLADGAVNFRHLNSRKRSRMSGYAGKVHQTAWSANSRWLATASTAASSVVVWDFSGRGPEGSEPLQLEGHQDRIECLAFQPNGPLLVSTGRDARVVLWRPGPGNRAALDSHSLEAATGTAAFSPDGRTLAVVQDSGAVRFLRVSEQ